MEKSTPISTSFDYGIDQTGQLMSGGGDGLGSLQSRPLPSKISAQGTLGIEKRESGHVKGSSGFVGNRFCSAAQDLAATDLGTGRQTEPRGKMFGRLPAGHIRADLGKNLEGCVGVNAVNAGQINPRYALERLLQDLIITGIMTNCCCETTARDAFMRDYRVFFVSDATATVSDELHIASLKNLAFGFAHVVDTKEICRHLLESMV